MAADARQDGLLRGGVREVVVVAVPEEREVEQIPPQIEGRDVSLEQGKVRALRVKLAPFPHHLPAEVHGDDVEPALRQGKADRARSRQRREDPGPVPPGEFSPTRDFRRSVAEVAVPEPRQSGVVTDRRTCFVPQHWPLSISCHPGSLPVGICSCTQHSSA